MALKVGELFATLALDRSNFDRGFASARAAGDGLLGQIGGLGTAYATLGAGIAAAAGVAAGAFANMGIQQNAMLEQSNIAWETLLGSQEQAKQQILTLQDLGAKTPFEFEGLDKSAKMLMMAGYKGEELTHVLTNVGDAVSAVGGGQAELEGVSMALFQMSAKGKVSAEEMNQLAERGIPAWELMGGKMGKSTQELMKMGEEGKLLAKDAMPALIEAMGTRFGGAMEKQSKTWNGMISTIKDNLKMISAEVTKPIFESVKKMMPPIIGMLDGILATLRGGGGIGDIFGGVSSGASIASVAIDTVKMAFEGVKQAIAPIGTMIKAAFAAFQGNQGKAVSILTSLGMGPDQIKSVMAGFESIKSSFEAVKATLMTGLQAIQGAMALFTGNTGKGVSILTSIGLGPDAIKQVMSSIETIKAGFTAFGSTVLQIFGVVGNFVMGVWTTIWGYLQPLIPQIVNFIVEKFTMVAQFWSQYGPQIVQAVTNVFNGIKAVIDFVMPLVMFVVQMAWDSIKGIISGALDVIMGVVKIFTGLFTGDWSLMWEGIKQAVGGAIEFIWNWINLMFIGRILKGIGSMCKGMWEAVKGGWQWIKEAYQTSSQWVSNLIGTWIDNIINWFRGMGTGISNVWNAIWGFIKGIVSTIANGVMSAFRTLGQGLDAIWNGIKSVVSSVWNAIWGFLRGLVSTIAQGVASTFRSLSSTLDNVWSTVKSAVSGAWNAIWGIIRDKASSMYNAVRDMGSNVKSAFTDMGNSIKDTVSRIWNQATEWGANIVKGLIKGIKNNVSGVLSAMGDLADKAIDKFKGMFGIASPSRLMKKFGGFITDGLTIGVDKGRRDVLNSLDWLQNAANQFAVGPDVGGLAMGGRRRSGAVIQVPVNIDGRQVAYATAEYMEGGINDYRSRNDRAGGVVYV